MTDNCNGNKRRRLTSTTVLSTIAMVMLFVIGMYALGQLGDSEGDAKGHYLKMVLACATGIVVLAVTFHGPKLIDSLSRLALAIRGKEVITERS